MGDFDIDTRVEGSGGRYRAHISREWEIWGPNGGYVAAIALRAAGRGAGVARPGAVSGPFPGRGGGGHGRGRGGRRTTSCSRTGRGRRTRSGTTSRGGRWTRSGRWSRRKS